MFEVVGAGYQRIIYGRHHFFKIDNDFLSQIIMAVRTEEEQYMEECYRTCLHQISVVREQECKNVTKDIINISARSFLGEKNTKQLFEKIVADDLIRQQQWLKKVEKCLSWLRYDMDK